MKRCFYLLILLFCFSCSTNNEEKSINIISRLKTNDVKLKTPQSGEWLYIHHENGQTLKQYQNCKPVHPNSSRNIIYLQPIGSFDSIQKKLIEYTSEYLEIFFGLNTKIAETLNDSLFKDKFTRIGFENNIQFFAPNVLSILKKRKPKNAIVYMAISEKDLYPNPEWNFVFGMASLRENVGVTSMHRLLKFDLGMLDFNKSLSRLIKVASHEIGHMFTMQHCINALCTMNGSNSLEESDRKPNRLCSECTGKIAWNLNLNIPKRLVKLRAFFKKHKLSNDLLFIENDLKTILLP